MDGGNDVAANEGGNNGAAGNAAIVVGMVGGLGVTVVPLMLILAFGGHDPGWTVQLEPMEPESQTVPTVRADEVEVRYTTKLRIIIDKRDPEVFLTATASNGWLVDVAPDAATFMDTGSTDVEVIVRAPPGVDASEAQVAITVHAEAHGPGGTQYADTTAVLKVLHVVEPPVELRPTRDEEDDAPAGRDASGTGRG